MTAAHVVVIGNLTIDDVVHAFGETTMASPGGNTIHAATAAKVWGVRVGLVARLGTDFPGRGARIACEMPAWTLPVCVRSRRRRSATGSSTSTTDAGPGCTERLRSVGRRWRPDPTMSRTPGCERRSPSGGAHRGNAVRRSGPHRRARPRPGLSRAVITLDTHEAWNARRNEVLDLARRVDVFLPSHEELEAILGYDDLESGVRRAARGRRPRRGGQAWRRKELW